MFAAASSLAPIAFNLLLHDSFVVNQWMHHCPDLNRLTQLSHTSNSSLL